MNNKIRVKNIVTKCSSNTYEKITIPKTKEVGICK